MDEKSRETFPIGHGHQSPVSLLFVSHLRLRPRATTNQDLFPHGATAKPISQWPFSLSPPEKEKRPLSGGCWRQPPLVLRAPMGFPEGETEKTFERRTAWVPVDEVRGTVRVGVDG
jgi:hypothetical protein